MTDVPLELKSKVELVNLKEIWNNKNEIQKKNILSLFNLNTINSMIYNRKIILLTQPLSEDRVLTEKEKVNIYNIILKKYDYNDVIIKPHPRETTNYEDFFNGVLVIEKNIPFELILLLNQEVAEKVITIFSSAARNVPSNIKVEWIGTSINEKLFKKFGKY